MRIKKANGIFNSIGVATICVIMVIIFALLMVTALTATSEMTNLGEMIIFHNDNPWMNILVLVCILVLFYPIWRNVGDVKLKWFNLAMCVWVVGFGLLWVGDANAFPSADSGFVHYASIMFARGEYEFLHRYDTYLGSYLNYFQHFPFQLGYVFFNEVLHRITPFIVVNFHTRAVIMQILNVFFLMGTYLFINKTLLILFHHERIVKLCCVLFVLLPQPIIFTTFVYGTIPGLFFAVLSIWLFMKFVNGKKTARNVVHGLLSVLCIALAVMLRQNHLIFLFAMVIVAGFKLLAYISEKDVKKAVLCVCYVAMACVLAMNITTVIIRKYEWRTGYDFGEGIPMVAWMVMGLSHAYTEHGESEKAPGWFNFESILLFNEQGRCYDAATEESWRRIRERYQFFRENPPVARSFFWRKMASQWNETTFQSIWNNQVRGTNPMRDTGQGGGVGIARLIAYQEACHPYWMCEGECGLQYSNPHVNHVKRYMDHMVQLVYAAVLICAVVFVIKSRQCDITQTIYFIIVTGGFLYHLLFEAKSQYIVPYFILLVPMAAVGLHVLYNWVYGRKEVTE